MGDIIARIVNDTPVTVKILADAGIVVRDDAYGAGWDGDTTHSPSRNAVYDEIENRLEKTTFNNHSARHENGGADKINVTGLSGELADNQPPKTHASSHKSGGGDEIKLNELGNPDGDVNINEKDLQNIETAWFKEEHDNGNSGAAKTINWNNGQKQKIKLTDNCTFTFTAPGGACNLVLKLIQNWEGSKNPVWPASVKWPGGTEPTWTPDADAIDIVTFYYDGTNYYGQAGLDFG